MQEEGAKDSLALKEAKEELGEVQRGYISELKGLQGRWKEELKGELNCYQMPISLAHLVDAYPMYHALVKSWVYKRKELGFVPIAKHPDNHHYILELPLPSTVTR